MRRPESIPSSAESSLIEPAPHSLGDIYVKARELQADMLARGAARVLDAGWTLIRRAGAGLGHALGNQGKRATIRELRRLDPRMLRDIGIDPEDIEGTVASLQRRGRIRPERDLGDVMRNVDRMSAPQHRQDARAVPSGQAANTDTPLKLSA